MMPADFTPCTLALAAAVHARINASTRYRSDPELYGRPEFWEEADGEGDCEDYALAYRQHLHRAGVDPSKLRLAVCRTEHAEKHLVLLVTTEDAGTVVLDNRWPEPRHRWQLGYQWIEMQEGREWVTVKN